MDKLLSNISMWQYLVETVCCKVSDASVHR